MRGEKASTAHGRSDLCIMGDPTGFMSVVKEIGWLVLGRQKFSRNSPTRAGGTAWRPHRPCAGGVAKRSLL